MTLIKVLRIYANIFENLPEKNKIYIEILLICKILSSLKDPNKDKSQKSLVD